MKEKGDSREPAEDVIMLYRKKRQKQERLTEEKKNKGNKYHVRNSEDIK